MSDESGEFLRVREETSLEGEGEGFPLELGKEGPSSLQVLRGVSGLAGSWGVAWAGLGLVTTGAYLTFLGLPLGPISRILLPSQPQQSQPHRAGKRAQRPERRCPPGV